MQITPTCSLNSLTPLAADLSLTFSASPPSSGDGDLFSPWREPQASQGNRIGLLGAAELGAGEGRETLKGFCSHLFCQHIILDLDVRVGCHVIASARPAFFPLPLRKSLPTAPPAGLENASPRHPLPALGPLRPLPSPLSYLIFCPFK